jgi:hypothetical protein
MSPIEFYHNLLLIEKSFLAANGLPFSCRERAPMRIKKGTISRAKRSVGTAC